MQQDLDSSHPELAIELLGVNAVGEESGNSLIVEGRALPWLQDVPESSQPWTSWGVTYRDVVILGIHNEDLGHFNLTTHDLLNVYDYLALRELLVDAALPEPSRGVLAGSALLTLLLLRRRILRPARSSR